MKSQETPTGTYVSCQDKAQTIVHHQWDPSLQSNEISNSLELHIHHHLSTSTPLQMWQPAVLTTGDSCNPVIEEKGKETLVFLPSVLPNNSRVIQKSLSQCWLYSSQHEGRHQIPTYSLTPVQLGTSFTLATEMVSASSGIRSWAGTLLSFTFFRKISHLVHGPSFLK